MTPPHLQQRLAGFRKQGFLLPRSDHTKTSNNWRVTHLKERLPSLELIIATRSALYSILKNHNISQASVLSRGFLFMISLSQSTDCKYIATLFDNSVLPIERKTRFIAMNLPLS